MSARAIPSSAPRQPANPLRKAIMHILGHACIGAGLVAIQTPAIAADNWDCRVAADGRSWECSNNGVAEQRTAEPAPTVIAAPTPPAATPTPLPETTAPEASTAAAAASAAAAAKPSPSPAPPAAPAQAASAAPPAAPAQTVPAQAAPTQTSPTQTSPTQTSPAQAAAMRAPTPAPTPTPRTVQAAPAPRPAPAPKPAPAIAVSSAPRAATVPDDLNAARPAASPTPPAAPLAAPMAASIEQAAAALDDGLDWQACGQTRDLGALASSQPLYSDAPIEVSADAAEASSLSNSAVFNGNVELQQGEQQIFAQQLMLNRGNGDLQASGDVLLKRPDLRMAASEVHYNLRSNQGEASSAEFRLPGIMARGSADKVTFVDAANSHYDNIVYTTCPPGNSAWELTAERLELDRAEGLGTADHAKLSFMGVPLAYLPTLTFPIDDRRRSGVLPPKIGYSRNLGADLAVPYYFNLAPNYDLTLTPRAMSRRGLMLNGEFRFLTGTSEGSIEGSFLPNDRKATQSDDRRAAIAINVNSRFNANLSGAIRYNQVSDDFFLSDFGNNLAVTSTSHLERTGELRYDTDSWTLLTRLQNYQTINPLLSKAEEPYARLPQVAFSYQRPLSSTPLVFELDSEFVSFRKSGNLVEGNRVDIQPAVSLPLREAHYHLVPRVSARYTSYDLDKHTGSDDSPDRLAGIFSLDGGLYYDRSTSWFGRAATQTLEPRLFYLYVPEEDHSNIPLFDTTEYDFSFDNLFRENRFTGADRLGDANQLTLALTSRLNDQASGREMLRASIGHIFYFEDREVGLSNTPVLQTEDSSATVGELAADFGNGWRARTGLAWDSNDNEIDQALLQTSYRDQQNNIFNLAYRLREGVTEHTDLGAVWSINPNTRLIGRWNYSLRDDRNLETLAGVEYGKCCWKIRALVREHTDSTTGDHDFGVMLQLQLNGLGDFGTDIDSLLDDGIYGYRRQDD